MRLGTHKTTVLLASSGLIAVTALAGCSSDNTTTPTDSPSAATTSASASPSPTASGTEVTFDSTLTSVYSSTDQVGKGKSQTYGVNVLSGTTTINSRSVRVRMLGTVEYTDKSGPIGGFLQLTWSDGTTLGMRQEGTATYDADTSKTKFDTKLTVINGSGKAAGTTGSGTWTGSRSGTVGSSIKINVTLNLTGAPTAMTGESASGPSETPSSSYAATIAP